MLRQSGGPIERIEHAPGTVAGVPCTHAMAFLVRDLFPDSVRTPMQIDQADGAGSHRSEQVACHMAVSEALERWAIFGCRADPSKYEAGIHLDTTSNGFAAFPGMFDTQARKAAFAESIERHCLMCWWEGYLKHQPLLDLAEGVRAIQIENPYSSHFVILAWRTDELSHVFAFGAGNCRESATWKTLVELERTQRILREIDRVAGRQRSADFKLGTFERRIEYFSRGRGLESFLKRLQMEAVSSAKPMKLLFDAPVKGPWNRYASVWRTIIEAPSRTYLSDADDYFFW
ncbi:hypothetical protein [Coraliomargarita parva]|uniref:hypothetical protein n=1 Tax=Coraliomargarita parva TaxID=3014050 RepID=UPI0022B34813|nr:hypothetical protein [Coraliomargarita parva]